jgi:hypothetical protein
MINTSIRAVSKQAGRRWSGRRPPRPTAGAGLARGLQTSGAFDPPNHRLPRPMSSHASTSSVLPRILELLGQGLDHSTVPRLRPPTARRHPRRAEIMDRATAREPDLGQLLHRHPAPDNLADQFHLGTLRQPLWTSQHEVGVKRGEPGQGADRAGQPSPSPSRATQHDRSA